MTYDLPSDSFEQRKRDHISLSLQDQNEALGGSGLDQVELIHEALPDLVFTDIEIGLTSLGEKIPHPFFISSMTAGHEDSHSINFKLAEVGTSRGWWMGVGSQRKELTDPLASREWKLLRQQVPNVRLMGNIGIAQVITSSVDQIQKLVEDLEAQALFVHTNPLQEVLQPEGTPQFAGAYKALDGLCQKLSVPVILKETGCGFSQKTLQRLKEIPLAAVDVSGYGGTHWGRIEGGRSDENSLYRRASQTFSHWGISTVDSLQNAKTVGWAHEIWASGGLRSGLDAAKAVAMGAQRVGVAKPLLKSVLQSEKELDLMMHQMEYEFKMALFCTGFKTTDEFQQAEVWQWKKS